MYHLKSKGLWIGSFKIWINLYLCRLFDLPVLLVAVAAATATAAHVEPGVQDQAVVEGDGSGGGRRADQSHAAVLGPEKLPQLQLPDRAIVPDPVEEDEAESR